MLIVVAAILLAVIAALAWLAHDAAGEQVGGKHKARGNADRWDA